MTKLDWNRRPQAPRPLPKATPISRAARQAIQTQKRNLRKQHLTVNQDPVVKHATHRAGVIERYSKPVLWCCECDCLITNLSQEEYEIWQEVKPAKYRRKSAAFSV